MKISLAEQVILVTGGSRGIGAAIVRQLAQAGASVALQYHRSEAAAQELAAAFPQQVALFQADLADPQACTRLVTQVIERCGQLHVLVNNAGIAVPVSPEADPATWHQVWTHTLQVNLVAASLCCKAALPHFQARGGGRFIHMASRAAFRGDTPEYLAYAASKGGMVALSRSLARAYGKQGITSFVVAPGFTRTDMAQQFIDDYGEDFALSDIALPRLTEPEDIAPTVLFLASGHMDHATGCTIDLNAGSYVR